MKKTSIIKSLALLSMLTLAACGGDDNKEQASGALLDKQLVIAHDTNFKPFEFRDENGDYVGFDIDLWKEIATRTGIEYTFQPMDFNGIIPALQAGGVDAAVAGITITPERAEAVSFSNPYYTTGLMLAIRATDKDKYSALEDMEGKVLATKTATSSALYLANDFTKAADVKLFPNTDSLLLELQAGGVDGVFFDEAIVNDFAKVSNNTVIVVGPIYQGQNYGVAFTKNSPYVDLANEAIASMIADGTYDAMYEKWFEKKPVK